MRFERAIAKFLRRFQNYKRTPALKQPVHLKYYFKQIFFKLLQEKEHTPA
jgi:hypothetical protein